MFTYIYCDEYVSLCDEPNLLQKRNGKGEPCDVRVQASKLDYVHYRYLGLFGTETGDGRLRPQMHSLRFEHFRGSLKRGGDLCCRQCAQCYATDR